MKTDVRLSTRFLTTQNAHQVGMLVTLDGETPVRRPPVNVALVLDRSGSMSGMPLEAAKDAAARFAAFLTPTDRLTVVTFDDTVRTIFGPGPAGTSAAAEAIARVAPGGSTNLSGGWLKGAADSPMEAAPTGAELEEEVEDLRAEAARLEERRFDATDRKYHQAQAVAARDMKVEYARQVRRPRKES
jgi:VWA domain-containing protein